MYYTLEKIWLNVKILLYNYMNNSELENINLNINQLEYDDIEEEYYIFRKYFIYIIWTITYFYNFLILYFFYYPDIVDMNFNSIDNSIIYLCRIFCIIDLSTPILMCLFKSTINKKFIRDIGYDNEYINLLFDTNQFNTNQDNYYKNKINEICDKIHLVKYRPFYKKINKNSNFDIEKYKLVKREYFKNKNYRYNYFKLLYVFSFHGSFQWYALFTSVYCNIVLIINFSILGLYLWGIYFFLLVLNIITIEFSIYSNFFNRQKFISNILQLLDLGTDMGFIYSVGGASTETLEKYGIFNIFLYGLCILISYFSIILLHYYSFSKSSIRNDEQFINKTKEKINNLNNEEQKFNLKNLIKNNNDKIEKLSFKESISNIILSICDASLIYLTIDIHKNDIDNQSITIACIITSTLTILQSISSIIDNQQKNYEYKI